MSFHSENTVVGIVVAVITAALVALGISQGRGGELAISLLPMPAAALAASFTARELPHDWRFARTFSASVVVAVGLAATGLVGGFGMLGWLVAVSGLLAAGVEYRALRQREHGQSVGGRSGSVDHPGLAAASICT